MVLFCDSHILSMGPAPGTLESTCGGNVGMLCARGDGTLFNIP